MTLKSGLSYLKCGRLGLRTKSVTKTATVGIAIAFAKGG